MKKTAVLLVLCVSMLVPTAARANDGGFWDMLFHWGTKFAGIGTDFHLVCLTAQGQRIKDCEQKFRNLKNFFHPTRSIHAFTTDGVTALEFKDITHELNLRLTGFHSYGEGIPTEFLSPGQVPPGIWAAKVMVMYNYRFGQYFDLGGGAGVMPVFGNDIKPFWRGVLTASAVIAPFKAPAYKAWYGRIDVSRLTNRLDGSDWNASAFELTPQWNLSFAIGFDLRRDGQFRATRTP
jgi:hypothetical protein